MADLQTRGAMDPVVSVTSERTGDLVLAVPIRGQRYRVPAGDDAAHTVRVRHEDQEQVFEQRTPKAEPETVAVEFSRGSSFRWNKPRTAENPSSSWNGWGDDRNLCDSDRRNRAAAPARLASIPLERWKPV